MSPHLVTPRCSHTCSLQCNVSFHYYAGIGRFIPGLRAYASIRREYNQLKLLVSSGLTPTTETWTWRRMTPTWPATRTQRSLPLDSSSCPTSGQCPLPPGLGRVGHSVLFRWPLGAIGILFQEAGQRPDQLESLRQGATGRFQRCSTFQVPGGRPPFSAVDRPLPPHLRSWPLL